MSSIVKSRKSRTQAERSSASTEAILNAAIELFAEHGSSVSLEKIGQRAGFSHGLVMSRFGGKKGLIKAVTAKTQDLFVQSIVSKAEAQSGLAAILAIAREMASPGDQVNRAGSAFYVLLGEAMRPNGAARPEFVLVDEIFRSYLAKHLRHAIDAGEVPDHLDVDTMAFILVGMFRGAVIQKIVNPQSYPSNDFRASMQSAVKSLLLAPERTQ